MQAATAVAAAARPALPRPPNGRGGAPAPAARAPLCLNKRQQPSRSKQAEMAGRTEPGAQRALNGQLPVNRVDVLQRLPPPLDYLWSALTSRPGCLLHHLLSRRCVVLRCCGDRGHHQGRPAASQPQAAGTKLSLQATTRPGKSTLPLVTLPELVTDLRLKHCRWVDAGVDCVRVWACHPVPTRPNPASNAAA